MPRFEFWRNILAAAWGMNGGGGAVGREAGRSDEKLLQWFRWWRPKQGPGVGVGKKTPHRQARARAEFQCQLPPAAPLT